MRPGLVIFDCDGVLVDSEPISLRVLVEAIGAAGLAMTAEVASARFLGRSMASVVEALREEDRIDLTERGLAAMRARLFAAFETELAPIPGVAAALDSLPCPACVASSSNPERIALSLRLTGLHDRFAPNVFSAAMVANGKPAPDLFLLAAARMGVAPPDCVVVEDSPAGVAAARAAGMRALGFAGGGHCDAAQRARLAASGPEAIFADMADLAGLLAGPAEAR